MLGAWGAAALAVLSKGIVVGVLAGAALILYTLSERDTHTWRRLHPGRAWRCSQRSAAPWFVVVSLRNPSFPGFFFVHEHFTRFLTTVHQRVEPWWYFLRCCCWECCRGSRRWRGPAVAPGLEPLPRRGGAGAAGGGLPQFKPLKFLLIFAAVTLVFFSASGSKLAPTSCPCCRYWRRHRRTQWRGGEFARQAARIGAGLVLFVAADSLSIAPAQQLRAHQALWWALAGALAALVAVAVSFSRQPTQLPASIVTAASAILAWQCLLCEYTLIPPARSARDLVSTARPFIGARTPLYSVGQYRETVSPYLGRTLQPVGFEES